MAIRTRISGVPGAAAAKVGEPDLWKDTGDLVYYWSRLEEEGRVSVC